MKEVSIREVLNGYIVSSYATGPAFIKVESVFSNSADALEAVKNIINK